MSSATSTSTSPPLPRFGQEGNASSRAAFHDLSIPAAFQLFDISEDNRFLALLDDNFMLRVYDRATGQPTRGGVSHAKYIVKTTCMSTFLLPLKPDTSLYRFYN